MPLSICCNSVDKWNAHLILWLRSSLISFLLWLKWLLINFYQNWWMATLVWFMRWFKFYTSKKKLKKINILYISSVSVYIPVRFFFIWLVDVLVFHEGLLTGESLWAVRTGKGPLPGVHPAVKFEVVSWRALFVALWTGEWRLQLVVGMHLLFVSLYAAFPVDTMNCWLLYVSPIPTVLCP